MQLYSGRFNVFDVSWIVLIFAYTFYRFEHSKTISDKRVLSVFLSVFVTAVLVQFFFDEPYTIEQWFVGMSSVSSPLDIFILQLPWLIIAPLCLLLFFSLVSQEFHITKYVLIFLVLTEVMQLILSARRFGDYASYVSQTRITDFWYYYIWQRVTFAIAYVASFKTEGRVSSAVEVIYNRDFWFKKLRGG